MESPKKPVEINVLALVKENERYVFLFDDEHKGETLKTMGRFASNPELSFSWYDVAVLSQKMLQHCKNVMEYQTNNQVTPSLAATTYPANRLPLHEPE